MRFLRMREVEKITARSRTSIWRDVKAGTFPPPVPVGGRSIAFVEEEVQDWCQARIDARDEALGLAPDNSAELDTH